MDNELYAVCPQCKSNDVMRYFDEPYDAYPESEVILEDEED